MVRSMLLRGFDRECVDKIDNYMATSIITIVVTCIIIIISNIIIIIIITTTTTTTTAATAIITTIVWQPSPVQRRRRPFVWPRFRHVDVFLQDINVHFNI